MVTTITIETTHDFCRTVHFTTVLTYSQFQNAQKIHENVAEYTVFIYVYKYNREKSILREII